MTMVRIARSGEEPRAFAVDPIEESAGGMC
jgi:hypothetical protein